MRRGEEDTRRMEGVDMFGRGREGARAERQREGTESGVVDGREPVLEPSFPLFVARIGC